MDHVLGGGPVPSGRSAAASRAAWRSRAWRSPRRPRLQCGQACGPAGIPAPGLAGRFGGGYGRSDGLAARPARPRTNRGRVLAAMHLTPIGDLAEVEPVLEQMGERSHAEADTVEWASPRIGDGNPALAIYVSFGGRATAFNRGWTAKKQSTWCGPRPTRAHHTASCCCQARPHRVSR